MTEEELWAYASALNPFHIGIPSTKEPQPEEPFEVLWYPTRIWNNQEDR